MLGWFADPCFFVCVTYLREDAGTQRVLTLSSDLDNMCVCLDLLFALQYYFVCSNGSDTMHLMTIRHNVWVIGRCMFVCFLLLI